MFSYASTFLGPPKRILGHLSRLKEWNKQNRDHPFIWTLSSNTPTDILPDLIQTLTTTSTNSIGCLSAPLTGAKGISDDNSCCSVGLIDPRLSPVFFRSTIPGRPSPQVGRWHSLRSKHSPAFETADRMSGEYTSTYNENVDWNDVWQHSRVDSSLPSELEQLAKT
jgi:hypothetical protein